MSDTMDRTMRSGQDARFRNASQGNSFKIVMPPVMPMLDEEPFTERAEAETNRDITLFTAMDRCREIFPSQKDRPVQTYLSGSSTTNRQQPVPDRAIVRETQTPEITIMSDHGSQISTAPSPETGLPLHNLHGDPIVSPEESRAEPGAKNISLKLLAIVAVAITMATGAFMAVTVLAVRFLVFMISGH